MIFQCQVDVSNIYGLEPGRQRALRSLEDGKMKVRIVNGEQMPPLLSDVPIPMMYPQDFPEEEKVSYISLIDQIIENYLFIFYLIIII